MSYPPAFAVLEAEFTPQDTQYSAGQVLGGLQALGPVLGYSGLLIKSISILDDDSKGPALDVHIFDQPPASIPDQSPFTPDYEDLQKRSAAIPIAAGDYKTINGMKIAASGDINIVLPAPGCWVYLVLTGDVTFSPGKKVFIRIFVLG